MHGLSGRRPMGACASRSGFAIIEVAVVLALLAVLAPPIWGSGARVRDALLVHEVREAAARLFAEARWTAVAEGDATVVLHGEPPSGLVVSASGDTVALADLGRGGVSVNWQGTVQLRYGPLGLGRVSSRTLKFALRNESRRLVISSFGRVSRK